MAGERGGQGTVKKDAKTNTWYFVLDLGTVDGKRKQAKRRGFVSKAEAIAVRDDLRKKAQAGSTTTNSRMTLSEYLAVWREEKRHTVEVAAFNNYAWIMATYIEPWLGTVRLADLTHRVLNRHYNLLLDTGSHRACGGKCNRKSCPNGKPLSHRSVRLTHAVLSRTLTDAVEDYELIDVNPAARATQPKEERHEITPWNEAQARSFLTAIFEDRLYACWLLCLSTGMRRGELAGLRWQDVDLERGTVSIQNQRTTDGAGGVIEKDPKGKSRRLVNVGEGVVAALRSHETAQKKDRLLVGAGYVQSPYVFVDEIGQPYKPVKIYNLFQALCAKAKVPVIRLHDLRHTAATLMFAANVHPKVVQEILGHSKIDLTLNTYTHYSQTMGKAAAETMDGILFPKLRAVD